MSGPCASLDCDNHPRLGALAVSRLVASAHTANRFRDLLELVLGVPIFPTPFATANEQNVTMCSGSSAQRIVNRVGGIGVRGLVTFCLE